MIILDSHPIIKLVKSENRFLYQHELIEGLIMPGKSRGLIRLYVGSAVLRLVRRNEIVRATSDPSVLYVWGLSEWLDRDGTIKSDYLPRDPAGISICWPAGMNPNHRGQRAIVKRCKRQ